LRLKRKKVRVAFDSGILDFAGELIDPWMEEKNWNLSVRCSCFYISPYPVGKFVSVN